MNTTTIAMITAILHGTLSGHNVWANFSFFV